MKRSFSTLLTTLLFSAALVPNAMAQQQKSGFPTAFSAGTVAIAEQPTAKPTNQTETQTDGLSAPSTKPAPTTDVSSSFGSRPSTDSTYPGYCPSLPPGTQPGDWDYREALERCLYGS